MSAESLAEFVGMLRDSMQEDFQGAELEGFNIAMKAIHKWAKHDGDWESLAATLGELADGMTVGAMGDGFNAATNAFQGAVFALEYAGFIE